MKYIALIYTASEANPAYGTPEFTASLKAYQAASKTYVACGHDPRCSHWQCGNPTHIEH